MLVEPSLPIYLEDLLPLIEDFALVDDAWPLLRRREEVLGHVRAADRPDIVQCRASLEHALLLQLEFNVLLRLPALVLR